MAEPLVKMIEQRLPNLDLEVVTSERAFLDAPRDDKSVSFIDKDAIESLGWSAPPGHTIGICDEPMTRSIAWLPLYPWLSHVISTSMLQHPLATAHLNNVISTLLSTNKPRLLDWLGSDISGRRVRLAQSSKRAERLDKMSDYLNTGGVGARTTQLLRDAAEELLTNAFYDAPVAAGAVKNPISRTQEVSLPEQYACDMVYGCRDDLAIVRVRDPFGSLTRERLAEVLLRCSRSDMQVEVDETMGGAGLGLWRIFSVASFVAISVVRNRHTEFLVGIGKRTAGPRPYAFHLFFRDGGPRTWKLVETSVTKTMEFTHASEE
jgi:hypothetical protein